MRRLMLLLTALMLFAVSAQAESLVSADYTDVHTAMTQDAVLELTASEECMVEALQPDEGSAALLEDVYRFVWEEENRPARYYDEETQKEIARLIDGDIDNLHLTEIMRLQLTGKPERAVTVRMLLDVEYRVGQLIVVVLGIPQEDGEYVWYPYRGRVETLGEIKWDIPQKDWEALSQQPISFQVLTDRIGPGGGRLWGVEVYVERRPPIFSKDAGDVIRMRHWYTEWGEEIDDDFSVWLEALTRPMQEEVVRIGEFLKEIEENEELAHLGILDYFPGERKAEALLMMPPEIDPLTLIPYDIIALRDENYKDTYGDVNVEIVFGTAYLPQKAMVILAGFPIPDAEEAPFMEWYVLRAEALEPVDEEDARDDESAVEIGLKQLNLPRMEEEPMMLVVISEPVEQELTEDQQ